jgi:autotransporter-associated beta strand protein
MRPFSGRCLFVYCLGSLLGLAHRAPAQSWIGNSSANWSDAANWNPNNIPGTGATATFNAASSNTTISLGGGSQPIGSIAFSTATAAAYTLGSTAGDAFAVDAGGTITNGSGTTTLQTISAAINGAGALTITNGVNSATGGLTLAGDISTAGALTFNNTAPTTTSNDILTISGNITSAASVTYNALTSGTGQVNKIIIGGTNTYAGPTAITINTGSSVASGGFLGIVSDKPFGTGKVTMTLPTTGTNAPQIASIGAAHFVPNDMDLILGLTLVGSNNLSLNGNINIGSTTAQRTYNSAQTGLVFTFGSAASPATFTLGNPVSNGGDGLGKLAVLNAAAGAVLAINDNMQDAGAGGGTASGSVTAQGSGTVVLAGASTYTGVFTFGSSGPVVQVGSSTTGPAGAPTSGPLGVNTATAGNATASTLEAVRGNQTIANPIALTTGNLIVSSAPTTGIGGDPTGPHNLTLSGLISGASGIIKALQTGAPSNNLTLTNANTYVGATSIRGGTLLVNNTSGSGTGSGAVSAIGAGSGSIAVGTGGTLGGTGTIISSTSVTVSANAGGTQGGIVYPGPGGASAGTLNVPGMIWDPFGQFVFAHNANNNATGNNINGFLNGTGALDLENLSTATQFDINLKPLNFVAGTPGPTSYTIVTFAGGILGKGNTATPFDDQTVLSSGGLNVFTFSGSTFSGSPLPSAVVVGAAGGSQSIVVTFTPVPEPAFVLAVCTGVTGVALRLRRPRPLSV